MKREENSGRHEVKRERAPQHHRARFSAHAFVCDVKLFVKKTLALNDGSLVCTFDGFVLQASFVQGAANGQCQEKSKSEERERLHYSKHLD